MLYIAILVKNRGTVVGQGCMRGKGGPVGLFTRGCCATDCQDISTLLQDQTNESNYDHEEICTSYYSLGDHHVALLVLY